MNPWIRLYRESLHDPKLVTLSDRQHRAWHNCLLIADDTGTLPSIRNVAVHMRMSITDAEQILIDLVEAELIDADVLEGVRGYKMHGWAKRQYVSDISTERSKKHRARKAATNVQRCGNAVATAPDSDTDTDSDSDSDSETDSEPYLKSNIKNKFISSLPISARAKSNELGFNLGFNQGNGRKDKLQEIAQRAEGLGLDATELMATTSKAKPQKPSAYLTALCVNRLRERLPGLDEQIIRDALWGKQEPYVTVCELLMELQP